MKVTLQSIKLLETMNENTATALAELMERLKTADVESLSKSGELLASKLSAKDLDIAIDFLNSLELEEIHA